MSIRGTASRYNIPESTLRAKLAGKSGPTVGHTVTGRLLTDAEEQVLVHFIEQSQRRAMPLTKRTLLGALDDILLKEMELMYERNINRGKSTHERWWRGFRERRPEIVFRTIESLGKARKNLSERLIRQWYSDVKTYLTEMLLGGILLDPKRCFNFDETGIVLSAGYAKVLGIRGVKHCFEEKKAKEKQNITVLSTVGADGSFPPPMIIYPRKRISYEMSNVSGGFEFLCR